MHIRPAVPVDLPAIEALLETAGLPVDGLEAHLDDFVVAQADGELVAAGGMEHYGERALLRSVVVADHHKGKGIGTAICERLEESARKRGVRDIYLLTDTAQDYFAGRGYEVSGRNRVPAEIAATEEFTRLCPASAVLMQLHLTAGLG